MAEITYKGKAIEVLKPSGMFQYYSDKEGRFLKFDELDSAKKSIDKEGKKITESKKITLNEFRALVKHIIKEEIETSQLNYDDWNPYIPIKILEKLEPFGSSCFRAQDSRTCVGYYKLPDGYIVGGTSNYSLISPYTGGLIKKNGRLFERDGRDVTERYKEEASEYAKLSDSLKEFFNLV